MKKTKTLIIIFALFSMIHSQEFSLSDCVNIALEHKETLQSARLDLQSAKIGKVGSLSNILPSINFSGGESKTSYAGNSIDDQTVWSAGLTASQNIFDGGGWWNSIALANSNYALSKQVERQVLINVITEVHRAYYQVLKNQQLVEVAKQNLELAEQQVELAKKKFELGATKKTDLLKSEVARGSARSALISQQASLFSSVSELRNAMGILGSNNNELKIRDEILPLQSVPEFLEAVKILKQNNPEILAHYVQLKNAKLNKKLTVAQRLPSLSASLSYQATDPELKGLSDALNNDWMLTSRLSLSIPLFNGMALSTQTQQAKLAEQKQENALTTATNDAIVNLDNLLGIVSDYFKIIPIYEETLASAEEDLKLVSERYRLGSASILELLDAQVSVTSARVSLVSSKYDARIQETYLKAQLGILDKEFE